jgi:hypothetical protein
MTTTETLTLYRPVGPEELEAGRARNQRVEFLVSSGIEANLAVVQQRVVPIAFFSLGNGSPPPSRQATAAQVLRIKLSPGSAPSRSLGRRSAALRPSKPTSPTPRCFRAHGELDGYDADPG